MVVVVILQVLSSIPTAPLPWFSISQILLQFFRFNVLYQIWMLLAEASSISDGGKEQDSICQVGWIKKVGESESGDPGIKAAGLPEPPDESLNH